MVDSKESYKLDLGVEGLKLFTVANLHYNPIDNTKFLLYSPTNIALQFLKKLAPFIHSFLLTLVICTESFSELYNCVTYWCLVPLVPSNSNLLWTC